MLHEAVNLLVALQKYPCAGFTPILFSSIITSCLTFRQWIVNFLDNLDKLRITLMWR